MHSDELKAFLDEKVEAYENPRFLESDPIQIPHSFDKKEDIEIAGFLTATIAWGNRKSIIKNANKMMDLLDREPFNFVVNHSEADLKNLEGFVHRTFNGEDFKFFIQALKELYTIKGGMEQHFEIHQNQDGLQHAITQLKQHFLQVKGPNRGMKHISDPAKGSAAKRINMYLRWMVRPATKKVDFGLWKNIPPSKLSCPLDVHSGRVARKLGLLGRKANDAKALTELDTSLRKLDPNDPVKYDFALFGLGVFEKF